MLRQLAVCVTGHIQCWYCYLLARWRNAQKIPRVCATKRETSGDGIPLGDHLIDAEVSIRQGCMESADKGFETLAARRESRGEREADVIGTCHLIDEGQALLVDDLFIEAAGGGVVFFCLHNKKCLYKD